MVDIMIDIYISNSIINIKKIKILLKSPKTEHFKKLCLYLLPQKKVTGKTL